MNLDDKTLIEQVDTEDILRFVDALPQQIEDAWAHGLKQMHPGNADGVRQVVVCGMGGSSISGELLGALAFDTCRASIAVNRGYDLPAYVSGPETLVIALSHSGGTEETLSAVRQAIARGTKVMAITTGGKLAEVVSEAGGTVWRYDYVTQPRAALGWLYGLLLTAVSRMKLVPDLQADIEEAVALTKKGRAVWEFSVPTGENLAKQIAGELVGRIPVIWGGELLAPVAYRWKTQLNENAKNAAYFEAMPELNHNTVIGLGYPETLAKQVSVVQLASEAHNHPRVLIRHKVTYDILTEDGITSRRIFAQGKSRLAQQFNLIQLGDYVSYYLAIANRANPTPIVNIDRLKARLAEAE